MVIKSGKILFQNLSFLGTENDHKTDTTSVFICRIASENNTVFVTDHRPIFFTMGEKKYYWLKPLGFNPWILDIIFY